MLPFEGVFGVRGVNFSLSRRTLWRGVIGTFFERASRCLGVVGVRIPLPLIFASSNTLISDFLTLKCEGSLDGEIRWSDAPCFAGTMRDAVLSVFCTSSSTPPTSSCSSSCPVCTNGLTFSSFGSFRTMRRFARVGRGSQSLQHSSVGER